MTATVAIVIPCFRQARFLADAVASVKAQTFVDWEVVVVVGDAESATAARQLTADRVRLVEAEPRGVSDARNVGVRSTSTRLVLALDADDMIAPSFLARTVGAVGSSSMAVAYSDVQLVGDASGSWAPSWNRAGMLAANCLPIASLHTRALFDAIGGWDVSMCGFEDWAYWVSACRFDPAVAHVAAPLMLHRRWGSSRSSELDPHAAVWRAMIRARHPDLYGGEHATDRRTIATATAVHPMLARQLARFPNSDALREWVALAAEERDAPKPEHERVTP